ncbi:Hypothetical predicted protein [Podarcis lilfordi]|uniref:Uncharacterized protein n=1 Tax=Podarcis lilfordi TaxID=74358 RepID=A0AA35PML1_9SAUR|nr:Hypothetical predicted protein [Podarcis lilfordi]
MGLTPESFPAGLGLSEFRNPSAKLTFHLWGLLLSVSDCLLFSYSLSMSITGTNGADSVPYPIASFFVRILLFCSPQGPRPDRAGEGRQGFEPLTRGFKGMSAS